MVSGHNAKSSLDEGHHHACMLARWAGGIEGCTDRACVIDRRVILFLPLSPDSRLPAFLLLGV